MTFFSSIGVPAAGDIMNFVVLTAALSSLNAVPWAAIAPVLIVGWYDVQGQPEE